jgi:hypothetical protein
MQGNGGKVGPAMREIGLSEKYADNPQKFTATIAFQEALAEYKDYFPDSEVVPVHKSLLHSKKIEHMVFPLGPRTDEDEGRDDDEMEPQTHGGSLIRYGDTAERTTLSDEEIISLLAENNCTVKKIVHGEQARHVYFWVINGQDVAKALEFIYKIRGLYAPAKSINANINLNSSEKKYPQEVQAIKKKYNDELRKKLFNGTK